MTASRAHTFPVCECVGDDDRVPLIPRAGMSRAPGLNEWGAHKLKFREATTFPQSLVLTQVSNPARP